MKQLTKLFLCIFLCLTSYVFSQEIGKSELEKGVNFIETKVYSDEENARILKLFEGLRVADVSDGMDMVGLPGTGLVDPAIHASWIDLENLSHQVRGIAITARYVPTQRPDRPKPGEEFQKWEGHFYNVYSNGVVRDANARDTDEVVKEKVLLYLRSKGRGIRPGRNELESVNRPFFL